MNFFGWTRNHQNLSLWGMASSQRALHKSDLRPNHPHQSCIGTLKEFDCHGTQPQNVPTNVQILPTDVCKISNHIKPSSQNRIIAPMQVHTEGTVKGVQNQFSLSTPCVWITRNFDEMNFFQHCKYLQFFIVSTFHCNLVVHFTLIALSSPMQTLQ